jgi:hypothetical protein
MTAAPILDLVDDREGEEARAVLADAPALDLQAAFLPRLSEQPGGQIAVLILLGEELPVRLADGFGRRNLQPFGTDIPAGDAPVPVDHVNGVVRDRVDQQVKPVGVVLEVHGFRWHAGHEKTLWTTGVCRERRGEPERHHDSVDRQLVISRRRHRRGPGASGSPPLPFHHPIMKPPQTVCRIAARGVLRRGFRGMQTPRRAQSVTKRQPPGSCDQWPHPKRGYSFRVTSGAVRSSCGGRGCEKHRRICHGCSDGAS